MDRDGAVEIIAGTTPRAFRLADVMILVAATAVGLAMVRYDYATPWGYTPTILPGKTMTMVPSYRSWGVRDLATAAGLILAAWSPALLWIGLQRPRREIGASLRRPGLLSCAVATVVVFGFFGSNLFDAALSGWPIVDLPYQKFGVRVESVKLDLFAAAFPRLGQWAGPVVIVTWLLAAVRGGWRGRADWVEWTGRVVGAAWIVVFLARLR